MAEASEFQSEHYERELVGMLEDALHRERELEGFYRASAAKPEHKPETKAMFELIAEEEARHAQIIQGRLEENRLRLKVITWKGPLGTE